jgi:hypothetical protein
MKIEVCGAALDVGAGAAASLFVSFSKLGNASITSFGKSVCSGSDFSILFRLIRYQAKFWLASDGLENVEHHATRPFGDDFVFKRRAVDGVVLWLLSRHGGKFLAELCDATLATLDNFVSVFRREASITQP